MINLGNKARKKGYKITWFDGKTILTLPFISQQLFAQLQDIDYDSADISVMSGEFRELVIDLLSQNYEGYQLTAEDKDNLSVDICIEIFQDYMEHINKVLGE